MSPDCSSWRVGYPGRGNIITILIYCTVHGKRCAISSEKVGIMPVCPKKVFNFPYTPKEFQWRHSPIHHLGKRSLGVTGSPEKSVL
ncbi:hypothetical protein NPIL_129201 [Nephila pilipes]|uniref:Uncharacterized protein n=1 Tax=Nephila pilipes TaxID=299642 RepID=A0A8X6TRV6_NEPPI|nr:hypothetical protein NPIL_129201 [Nephila pilipes]